MPKSQPTSVRGPNRSPEQVALDDYTKVAGMYTRAAERAARLIGEARAAEEEASRLKRRADYAAQHPDLPADFTATHTQPAEGGEAEVEEEGDQTLGE